MRRFLRALLVVCAVGYPLAVAAVWFGLAIVGEHWWPSTVALYLPRLLFAAPLPLVVLPLAIWGPRRLLLLQAGAAAILLFPIMGLQLSGPAEAASARTLRVLSFNINYGWMSQKGVAAEIVEPNPDIVLLQAIKHGHNAFLVKALPGYHVIEGDDFYIASRYPILESEEPEGACFMRATIDTPLGVIDFFDLHPISPRPGFDAIRGSGLKEGLESGRVLRGDGSGRVAANTADRARQIAAVASAAAASKNIVVVAGDTNLPVLSPLFREQLGRWQDGFAEVGRGFGYTFPAHKWIPWMRIDRILAGPELRFLRFEVGKRKTSDHHAVWADLARRP